MARKKRPNLGIIFVVLFFIYFSYNLVDQQRIINEKNKEIDTIEKQIKAEEKKGSRLENQLKSVNSDENVQRTVREKLGYVKDGEKIFEDINR